MYDWLFNKASVTSKGIEYSSASVFYLNQVLIDFCVFINLIWAKISTTKRSSRLLHQFPLGRLIQFASCGEQAVVFTAMPGFDFSNYNRNAALHAKGVPLPKATSTGTTIVGCIFDGGVVIAADTRATSGPIVADKVRVAAPCVKLLS